MDESVLGISAEVSLPSDSTVGAAVQLYMINIDNDKGGSIEIMYDGGVANIYLEIEGQEDVFEPIPAELNKSYKLSIIHQNEIMHLLIDDVIKGTITVGDFSPNMIGLGAFHDEAEPFEILVENIRVLRKKSHPQGWMWTDHYPWAYSYETGGWLYFELAKDLDGNPVMNYYDHNSGTWDLYGPSLLGSLKN
jgi:hypothetical protein